MLFCQYNSTEIKNVCQIQKRKQTIYHELFWTAVAAIIIFLPKAFLPANGADQMIVTQRLVISAQGKGRCPDAAPAGPSTVEKARSRLDCARKCASREGCLHHAFHKNNGSCHLYYSTPASLSPAEDCNFMVASRFPQIICRPKVLTTITF